MICISYVNNLFLRWSYGTRPGHRDSFHFISGILLRLEQYFIVGSINGLWLAFRGKG